MSKRGGRKFRITMWEVWQQKWEAFVLHWGRQNHAHRYSLIHNSEININKDGYDTWLGLTSVWILRIQKTLNIKCHANTKCYYE